MAATPQMDVRIVASGAQLNVGVVGIDGDLGFLDDVLLTFGTDSDNVLVHRSATLAANTALTNVLLGTTAGSRQAIAADTLVTSNVTASGDQGFYVNQGGVSYEWLLSDASAGIVYAGMSVVGATSLFQVEHRDSTNTASHARLNIRVVNTSADPLLTLATAANTWYVGVDNSSSDQLFIGSGTVVGTTAVMRLDLQTAVSAALTRVLFSPLAVTVTGNFQIRGSALAAGAITLANTTPQTNLYSDLHVVGVTINQSGGAVTVDAAAGISATAPSAGASVTLTHSSNFRAVTGNAAVNRSGLYVETITNGTTGNYQILLAVSTGAAPALADHLGITARDTAADDTRLYIASEAGSDIIIGNDRLRFAAATGIIGIGATSVLTMTTSAVTLGVALGMGANNITMTGTIATTTNRLTNIFTTNQTTTNAETVDSWGMTKQNIVDYGDALLIVKGIRVVSYEHQAVFDPTGRRKLGVLAETVGEALVTPEDDYVGLGRGPRLDMLGLAALNTRAIQQVDDEVSSIRRQIAALESRLAQLEGAKA